MNRPPPNPASNPYGYLKWERETYADWYAAEAARQAAAAEREQERELKRLARRERRRVAKEALLAWQAGVKTIMEEVRRREAAMRPRIRVPAISARYNPRNPLDGERLWG